MKKSGRILYKIMIPYMLLAAALLAVSFLTLFFFSLNSAKRNSLEFTGKLIQQVDRSVSNYVGIMNTIFDALTEDELAGSYFSEADPDERAIAEKLDFVVNTRKDVSNIFLLRSEDFSEGMEAVSNDASARINPYNNYRQSTWYEKLFLEKREVIFTSSYVQNLIEGRYEWVISLGKKVYREGRLEGVILIDLKYSSIITLCENAMPKNTGYVFIVDDTGSIVYHPKQQLIYSGLMEEETALVSELGNGDSAEREGRIYLASALSNTGWRVAGVIRIDALLSDQDQMLLFFLVTAAVFILLACVTSYLISKRVTKPILSLERTVKQVQGGDLTAKAAILSNDEVGALSMSFNEMTSRVAELMEKNEREQVEKRESILKALKAQINPHFLYNTLDSIIWMAEAGRTEDIVEMTSSLAKMLRASLGKNSDFVTLKVELENVRNYLRIQKYRYGDKLNYTVEVPNELYGKRAEHLSLQPLVENAIYHGIRDRRGGGRIRIGARAEGGRIIVDVEDNGKGMTEERIAEIMSCRESGSMGVRNVDNRIKLTFGAQYGLSIESEPGRGTRVSMVLPDLDAEGGEE